MTWPGLIGMLSAISGLLLALPMAVIGIEFIGGGRPILGVCFLGLASALLFLPEFVLRRLPRPWRRFTRSD